MIKRIIEALKEVHRIVNDDTPERIIRELEFERKAVKEYLRSHDPYQTQYCSIQHGRCLSCGLMAWEKDAEHRYTAVNEKHLKVFYDMSSGEKKDVIGKTDKELIIAWREKTGKENTFGEMCVSTDGYVMDVEEPCRFFEFGYRLGKPLLLDVFKSPIMINGKFMGTRGNALNISDRESDAVDLLQFYMSMGIAERLDDGGPRAVAVYLVRDRRKTFNREFPG